MKKQLSDEQLDTMMRTLMGDAALDDSAVNDIADSPTIWWSVLREINKRKDLSASPWPPVGKVWRWLAIGVPVVAVLAIVIGIFVFRPPGGLKDVAGLQQNVPVETVTTPLSTEIERADTAKVLKGYYPVTAVAKRRIAVEKPTVRTANTLSSQKKNLNSQIAKSFEIKTDFIALSYARNPDSGQIVRVKVPSSMMVTLGLVASVEKPLNLVDAEILVGDDGLTRAIRFIH